MKTITEIEARHAKQAAVMNGFLDGGGFRKAQEAFQIVRALEQGTRKDGKTPKFHHQLSVTRLVTTLLPHLRYPGKTLTAALLHDILEDHSDQWSVDRLADRFGKKVANAVWTLSKKTAGMTKSYESYFAGMEACPIASIVKLADRAHNLQTMPGVFSQEKQVQYLGEVDEWFFPMIRRARRNFPRQYQAYENLKIILRIQSSLIRKIHEAAAPLITLESPK